jgi:hypothetical protein
MSIVALKRKTAALYGPHAAVGGFSLNGSMRSVGPGQQSLATSVTRTPFRGTVPMGHGGGARCRVRGIRGRAAKCNSHGDYVVNICNSGSCCTPDSTVKRSTMTTAGMLESRYKGILHGAYPNTWVKPQGVDTGDVALNDARNALLCGPEVVRPPGGCIGYTKPLNMHAVTYAQYMQKLQAGRFCMRPHFPFRVSQTCGTNFKTWQEAAAAGRFKP